MANTVTAKSISNLKQLLIDKTSTGIRSFALMQTKAMQNKKLLATKKNLDKTLVNLKGFVRNQLNNVWDVSYQQGLTDGSKEIQIAKTKASKRLSNFAAFSSRREPLLKSQWKSIKEEERTEDLKISKITERRFGKNYVQKRTDYLAENVSRYYLDELNELIPKYFESKNIREEKVQELYDALYEILSPRRISEDASDAEKLFANAVNTFHGRSTRNKVKKVIITELTGAYNLGRLEAFARKGYKFVRWNNDAENAAGMSLPLEEAIRRRKSYTTSPQYEGFAYDPALHKVCPICQERARRITKFGRGVYLIEELLDANASTSAPPLHPYCECFLEPLSIKEQKKILAELKDEIPIVVDEITKEEQEATKQSTKWVTGAGATILGTALMFLFFKQDVVGSLISKVTTTKQAEVAAEIINNIVLPEITNQITGRVVRQLSPGKELKQLPPGKEQVDKVNIPLKELKVEPKLSVEAIKQNQPLIKQANNVLRKEKYKNTDETLLQRIKREQDDVVKTINRFRLASPETAVVAGEAVPWQAKLDDIRERMQAYDQYLLKGQGLTSEQKKKILDEYTADLNLLNKELSNINTSMSDMYVKYNKLLRLRDEARDAMNRAMLAEEINPGSLEIDAFINSTTKVDELTQQLHELRRNIDKGLDMQKPGGFKDQLIEIQNRIRQNPAIQADYLKSQSRKINRAFNKIPADNTIININNQIDDLNNLVSSKLDNLTYADYRQLTNKAEELQDKLSAVNKSTRLPDVEVDVDFIIAANISKTDDIALKAATVKDTKTSLNESQSLLNRINFVLEQRKENLKQSFNVQRGATKSATIQKLQRRRRYLITQGRLEEAEAISNQIEQINRIEFKNNNKKLIYFYET